MDEGLMLPGQRELDLHLIVLVGHRVDCVTLSQPENIHFSIWV